MLTQQKKEIESIKERTITINLSDADCERIARLTGEHGISVYQTRDGKTMHSQENSCWKINKK